jgi:hypothetical protein
MKRIRDTVSVAMAEITMLGEKKIDMMNVKAR